MNSPFPLPVSEEFFAPELELVPIQPLPSETAFLRNIIPVLNRVLCLQDVPGDLVVTSATAATSGYTQIRAADPLAVYTSVENQSGGSNVAVMESNVIISAVVAGETKKLPMRGKGQLKALANTGTAYLLVRTWRRGECALPDQFLAPDEDPIGGILLL